LRKLRGIPRGARDGRRVEDRHHGKELRWVHRAAGALQVPEIFTAGNSLYGISNLELLATGTHKFESHYLFPLMFAKGTPEAEQAKILRDRSPCYHAERIRSPLLMLQGVDDKVVPLDQALAMEKVLKEEGKDVKLVIFEGEGHGFRKEENVKAATEEEERLWRRTLVR